MGAGQEAVYPRRGERRPRGNAWNPRTGNWDTVIGVIDVDKEAADAGKLACKER